MNCNQCKNPVDSSSIHCEWCGAKIVRQAGVSSESGGAIKHPAELLLERLLEVDNEMIEATGNKSPFSSLLKGGQSILKGDTKGLKDIAIGAGDLATGGVLGTVTSFITKPRELKAIAEKKATIITAYPLPSSNSEHLLEMANLSVSSFNQIEIAWGGTDDESERKKILKNAWKAKAEQAIEKLEMFALKDDFIKGKVIELKEKIKPKKDFKKIIIYSSAALVIFLLIIGLATFGNSGFDKEKERLEIVLEKVNTSIKDKDYDAAELLLNDLRWEYKAKTAGGADEVEELKKSWEEKRATLTNFINEKK